MHAHTHTRICTRACMHACIWGEAGEGAGPGIGWDGVGYGGDGGWEWNGMAWKASLLYLTWAGRQTHRLTDRQDNIYEAERCTHACMHVLYVPYYIHVYMYVCR